MDANATTLRTKNNGRPLTASTCSGVPQQQGEERRFGHAGDEGRHRRRSPLVDVRRPHVEGDHRQLEAHPGEDEDQPVTYSAFLQARHRGAERGEAPQAKRPGDRVDQRHAEHQKGRRGRGEHQVLQRRLHRAPARRRDRR